MQVQTGYYNLHKLGSIRQLHTLPRRLRGCDLALKNNGNNSVRQCNMQDASRATQVTLSQLSGMAFPSKSTLYRLSSLGHMQR